MTLFLKTNLLKLLDSNLRNANHIRYYARWSHRHPRRVLTSEEYDKLEATYQKDAKSNKAENIESKEEKIIELNPETDVIQQPIDIKHTRSKDKWIPKNLRTNIGLVDIHELDKKSETVNYKIEPKVGKKKKTVYKTDSKTSTDMLETVIDADGNFVYTKLKDNDPTVSQLLVTVKSRKEQIKKGLALLEGKRLIKDALEAQCTLKHLIFSRKSDVEFLKPYLPKSGPKLYKMPYREIQMWSDLTTTPGIMGIFKTPDIQDFISKDNLPLTIICDNIREPGNLGAVLRTAAGVGAESIILTNGCVDLWDTKVLRSACGAHFRLQIHKKMKWSDIRKQLSNSRNSLFIADNRIISENIATSSEHDQILESSIDKRESLKDIVLSTPLLPYYSVQFRDMDSLVLIVGGETEGISEEAYRLAADYNGVRLNIPLNNDVESLNTGTSLGIIMFEIKRQLLLHANYSNNLKMSVE